MKPKWYLSPIKYSYEEEKTLWKRCKFYVWGCLIVTFFLCCLLFGIAGAEAGAGPEVWKITAYCSCIRCCGKSDGITASGKKARYGYAACNWLPFGTRVHIAGLGYFTVEDRGAKSLFGSAKNHIKHLDIFYPTHAQAKNFGVKYLEVLEV